METMTPRERWLAAVRMEPVDRFPFWPKLDTAYPRAQAAPFCGMTATELHEHVGSDNHVGVAGCVREVRLTTSLQTGREGNRETVRYQTRHGEMTLVRAFDEASQSWHPRAFPVQSVEDIDLMTAFYDDVTVELDTDSLREAQGQCREIGERAVAANGIGTSPLMDWVQWLAGVENAHYLLNEHSGRVEALFDAMHRVMLRKTEIMVEHSPADLLYLVENTSTTLISPEQYRRLCYPHIMEYAALGHAGGRNVVLHMCGHLQALLPDLATLPVRAFEAFTSPTLGNTTLLDGRTQCPDTCLIGGTNAMLWTHPADAIIAQLKQDLVALPHHRGIVITSAGVMPPLCSPETIRTVCDWVKAFPARMN
jgi:uroporphyrinogen-III decarboxylase